jgi:hypothetical protein
LKICPTLEFSQKTKKDAAAIGAMDFVGHSNFADNPSFHTPNKPK